MLIQVEILVDIGGHEEKSEVRGYIVRKKSQEQCMFFAAVGG